MNYEYDLGRPIYAIIHVREGSTESWPVVERVPGGWSSGVHHYRDEDVLDVQPLEMAARRDLETAQQRTGYAYDELRRILALFDATPEDLDVCEVADFVGDHLAELHAREASAAQVLSEIRDVLLVGGQSEAIRACSARQVLDRAGLLTADQSSETRPEVDRG
jgi:hypothetical protein